MSQDEIKQKAKEIKQFYIDELAIHRNNGNYKFEITPSDIQKVFLMGVEFGKYDK